MMISVGLCTMQTSKLTVVSGSRGLNDTALSLYLSISLSVCLSLSLLHLFEAFLVYCIFSVHSILENDALLHECSVGQ